MQGFHGNQLKADCADLKCLHRHYSLSILAVHGAFRQYLAIRTEIVLYTGITKIMSAFLTKAINLGYKTLEKITLLQETQPNCTYFSYQTVSHKFALSPR